MNRTSIEETGHGWQTALGVAVVAIGLSVWAEAEAQVDWDVADLWYWPDSPTGASGDPTSIGQWAAPVDIPDQGGTGGISPVHAALLPYGEKGKLIAFRNTIFKIYDLNDSTSGESTTDFEQSNDHRPFCNGASFVPDGRLLVVGGSFWRDTGTSGGCIPNHEGWASLFDPSGDSFARTADTQYGAWDDSLNYGRYYPSLVTLPDGTICVAGGDAWVEDYGDTCWSAADEDSGVVRNGFWEVWDPATGQWDDLSGSYLGWRGFPGSDDGLAPEEWPYYPHLKVLPSGLFWEGYDNQGSTQMASVFWKWGASGPPKLDYRVENRRNESSCVVLTLGPDITDPQRILLIGGGDPADCHPNGEIITYSESVGGVVTSTGWSLSDLASEIDGHEGGRRRPDAVLLPTGDVLVAGGEDYHDAGEPQPNRQAEMFDADSLSWRLVDSLEKSRMYHSNALLLPDGRVFVAGDEGAGPDSTDEDGKTYEIFYPPYLFESSSAWADRPVITALPDSIYYGLDALITVGHEDTGKDADDIAEICLVKTSTSTHATNMSQRRVLLDFDDYPNDDETLVITPPRNGRWAPPGYYMLFAIDSQGVPSVGKFLKVTGDSMYDGSFEVAAGDTAVWAGECYLDRDFVVEDGGKLTVLPGTTVWVETTDRYNVGVESNRVELIVEGQLEVDGEPDSLVTFRSVPGTGTSDWRGIRFENTASDTSDSAPDWNIDYAHISNAFRGAELDSASGNLFHTSFASNGRDIYLPGDTRIWEQAKWGLEAGTRVLADTACAYDWPWGTTGKTDLIVQGKLFTYGEASAGDSVYFAPTDITDVTGSDGGQDWGGIILDMTSDGSVLDYVDIGYAANPIFAYYPDSLTTIRNSTIHHFADTGIWVQGASGQGGVIVGCTVERGSGMNDSLGTTGIFVDQADELNILNNTIDLDDLAIGLAGIGLSVRFGQAFCESIPLLENESLLIQGNTILGRGASNPGQHVGVKFDWVCGDLDRSVDVDSNYVAGWNKYGMEFLQDSDLQVSCNNIEGSDQAVHVSRDEEPSGVGVRFLGNRIAGLMLSATNHAAIGTDNAVKTRLGRVNAYVSDKGDNEIVRYSTGTSEGYFVFEDDPDDADYLLASYNYWYISNGSTETPVNSATSVRQFIKPTSQSWEYASVTLDTVLVSPSATCYPSPPDPEAHSGRGYAWLPDGPNDRSSGDATDLEQAIPLRTYLGAPAPNPSRTGLEVELGIAASGSGRWTAVVYDIRGRRVAQLQVGFLTPGIHEMRWDGRDEGGRATAAGIYFLRVQGPDHGRTLKIVRVR